jgi:hypothetical protein
LHNFHPIGQDAEFILWDFMKWIQTLYKAGCRIQPLDLWTSILPLQVRIDASSVFQNISSHTLGQDTLSRLLEACSIYRSG